MSFNVKFVYSGPQYEDTIESHTLVALPHVGDVVRIKFPRYGIFKGKVSTITHVCHGVFCDGHGITIELTKI